jgi:rhodanese-related sulfurtransferase
MIKGKMAFLAAVVLLGFGLFLGGAFSQEVTRISKEELRTMLENPEVIILDVRAQSDWQASRAKIKGAVREDPSKLASWMGKYPKNKVLVFYCD